MAYGKQHPGQRTPTYVPPSKRPAKVTRFTGEKLASDLLEGWLNAIHGSNWRAKGNGSTKSVKE